MEEGHRILRQERDPPGLAMHLPGEGCEQPGDGAQQRRLPATVGTHECDDLAGATFQADPLENGGARRSGRDAAKLPGGPGRCRLRGCGECGHLGDPALASCRRVGDAPALHREPASIEQTELVEAMLGDHHRRARSGERCEDGHQRSRAILVELGERLVEHEQARTHGEDAGKGEALTLAAGERGDRTAAQVRDARLLQRLRDP